MVSIGSKHRVLKEFYKLLGDFKNHKPVTIETKNCKNRIMNNANQLSDKYFGTCKKYYDSEDLNEEDKSFFDLTSLKYLVRKN